MSDNKELSPQEEQKLVNIVSLAMIFKSQVLPNIEKSDKDVQRRIWSNLDETEVAELKSLRAEWDKTQDKIMQLGPEGKPVGANEDDIKFFVKAADKFAQVAAYVFSDGQLNNLISAKHNNPETIKALKEEYGAHKLAALCAYRPS